MSLIDVFTGLDQLKLTTRQASMLLVLADAKEPLSNIDLVFYLQLAHATISMNLKLLVARGLAEVPAHRGSANAITITAAGRQVATHLNELKDLP